MRQPKRSIELMKVITPSKRNAGMTVSLDTYEGSASSQWWRCDIERVRRIAVGDGS